MAVAPCSLPPDMNVGQDRLRRRTPVKRACQQEYGSPFTFCGRRRLATPCGTPCGTKGVVAARLRPQLFYVPTSAIRESVSAAVDLWTTDFCGETTSCPRKTCTVLTICRAS